MRTTPMRPAMRRYTWRLMGLLALYVGALFGAKLLFRHVPPTGAVAYAVAILPALPILGVFITIGRLLVEMDDEYVRMLLVRQTLVATAFMLSVTTSWGFLNAFDLAPRIELYWPTVLWFAGLGVGGLTNALIERRAGS